MREELPEKYFHTRNTVKRIDQLLKGMFPKKPAVDKTYHQIRDAWQHTVNDKILQSTEITGFKSGVLYVCVESSAMIHHLTNFEKNAIISGINRIMGSKYVDDIRFKAGYFK